MRQKISIPLSGSVETNALPAARTGAASVSSSDLVREVGAQNSSNTIPVLPAGVSSRYGSQETIVSPVRRRKGKAAAIDVAKYLVYLSACEDEPDYLSHLRIQKLLYYVQGWSLALRDKQMFDDRIEAWAHGPVVPKVYAAFASFGRNPILLDDVGLPNDLTDEELQFIRSVWEAYKKYSASSLREMTHQESPWLNARQGIGPADRCENEITSEALKSFFSSSSKK